jgi:hypothetical protein
MTSRAALAVLLLGALAAPSRAAENSLNAEELKVYSPTVVKGERELEWRGFATGGHQQGFAASAGWSPTSWLNGEAYEVMHREPGGPLVGDAVVVEGLFAPFAPGELWADLGLIVEGEFPRLDDDPNAASVQPVLEKQFGRALLTLNLPLEWKYGRGFTPGTHFAYRAKAEWLASPYASPALESFGEPGVIGNFDATRDQTHLLGPALYGSVAVGSRRRLRYSLAALIGLTPASPRETTALRLEFEF